MAERVKTKKTMRIVFKGGSCVITQYAYKAYYEISTNLGKDHKVEATNFSLNTKEVIAVFFEQEVLEDEEVQVKKEDRKDDNANGGEQR